MYLSNKWLTEDDGLLSWLKWQLEGLWSVEPRADAGAERNGGHELTKDQLGHKIKPTQI